MFIFSGRVYIFVNEVAQYPHVTFLTGGSGVPVSGLCSTSRD